MCSAFSGKLVRQPAHPGCLGCVSCPGIVSVWHSIVCFHPLCTCSPQKPVYLNILHSFISHCFFMFHWNMIHAFCANMGFLCPSPAHLPVGQEMNTLSSSSRGGIHIEVCVVPASNKLHLGFSTNLACQSILPRFWKHQWAFTLVVQSMVTHPSA